MMKTKSWRLGGGLDLITPQVLKSRYPGAMSACLNYEDMAEGYRRCDGFERFDGRASPSSMERDKIEAQRAKIGTVPGKGEVLGVWRFRGVSYAFKEALSSSEIRMYRTTSSGWSQVPIHKIMGFTKGRWIQPERDQFVKGLTSGATAIIKEVALIDGHWPDSNAEGSLVVDDVRGIFQASELLVVGQETGDNAVVTGAVAVGQADDGFAGYRYSAVAADQVGNINASGSYPSQADIREFGVRDQQFYLEVSEPDDEGFFDDKEIHIEFPQNRTIIFRFLGATKTVFVYTGDEPATRLDAETGRMRQRARQARRFRGGGFTEDDENVGEDPNADRPVQEYGAVQYRWPLIQADLVNPPAINDRITFRVRQKGYVPTHREMTATGPPVEQKIYAGPESRFQFINHNFFGQAGQERMYGVSGSGPCFEFDGRTFISIFTGVDNDRPILVAAHQKHLFLAYKWGSVMISGLGRPRSFRAIDGAAEIAIGDEVTGILSGFKGILILTGRNRTEVLRGTSAADWDLKTLSEKAGAIRHTLVQMETPVYYDDRGIREVEATEQFGDLSIGLTSESVRPFLDRLRKSGTKPVSAIQVRNKSQYRLWFDDGQCLVVRHGVGYRGQKTRGYSIGAFYTEKNDTEHRGIVTNICSVEDPDGLERIFFTLEGSGYVYEMDRGDSFDGTPIPAYFQLPFNDLGTPGWVKRFAIVQLDTSAEDYSKFKIRVDFDDDRGERFEVEGSFNVLTELGWWGESHWDEFYWNDEPERIAEARVEGRGRNLAIMVASEDKEVTPPHVISGVTVYYVMRRMRR